MFWTVLEIQMAANGTKACIPVIYDNLNNAISAYYTICAAAAQSVIPYHAAFVLADNGNMVKAEIFDRRVAPEPEV